MKGFIQLRTDAKKSRHQLARVRPRLPDASLLYCARRQSSVSGTAKSSFGSEMPIGAWKFRELGVCWCRVSLSCLRRPMMRIDLSDLLSAGYTRPRVLLGGCGGSFFSWCRCGLFGRFWVLVSGVLKRRVQYWGLGMGGGPSLGSPVWLRLKECCVEWGLSALRGVSVQICELGIKCDGSPMRMI